MAPDPAEEIKRLLRRLFDAWDAWIDSDRWAGPEYDTLAGAVEGLRRYLQEHEAS